MLRYSASRKDSAEQSMWKRAVWHTAELALPIGVAVLFSLWLALDTPEYFESVIAAALTAVLFCTVFVCLIARFRRDTGGWQRGESSLERPRSDRPVKFLEALRVLGAALAFRFLVCVIAFLLRYIINGYTATFVSVQRMWGLWSFSSYYLTIAEDGYSAATALIAPTGQVIAPLYSYVVKLFSLITSNYVRAGFAVSTLCTVFGSLVLYLLVVNEDGRSAARRALRWFMVLPASFLLSCTIPDSMLFLFCVSSLYFTRKQNFGAAGAFAVLAVWTDLSGCALMAALVVEYIVYAAKRIREHTPLDKRIVPDLLLQGAGLLLVPLSFALFLFLYSSVGANLQDVGLLDANVWLDNVLMFFRTAGYQCDLLINTLRQGSLSTALSLWMPNLLFLLLPLAVMTFSASRVRASYIAMFLATFLCATGAGWVVSMPRLMCCSFPFILGVVQLTRNRWVDAALELVSFAMFIAYFYAFAARWGVY